MKTQPAAKVASVTIQRKALSSLVPHPRNPRKHPEPGSTAWESLKRSLEHSYFDPIVYNARNRMLVSGHLRTKVLADAGFTEVDCVVVDYDENTHIARMIAANKNYGSDDLSSLNDLLTQLGQDPDFNLDLTGMDAEAVDGILDENIDQIAQRDEKESPPAKAKSQRHITIGRHRIPLTDEEFAKFSEAYEAYEKRTGTRYGFVASILTPPKKRKVAGAQPA